MTPRAKPLVDAVLAHHEARHAIVAWDQGVHVGAVSIDQLGDIGGRFLHSNIPRDAQPNANGFDGRARSAIEKQVRIALGGSVARLKFGPRTPSWVAASTDEGNAVR